MKKSTFILLSCILATVPFAAKADESRVNLWPLAGYDDGAFDVLWPLGHFKDASEWRFFPVVKEPGMFCVFPEFWFGKKGFAVLPFAAQYDFNAGTLFPVVWWKVKPGDTTHSLFPLYFYRDNGPHTTFWAGAGLAGYYRDGAEANHWFVPFYARAYGNFFSIPYSRVRHNGHETAAFLCGLAGCTTGTNGATAAAWCWPLFYRDTRKFASLPLVLNWNREGALESWLSLPVLSAGWQDGDTWNERYVIALAGRDVNEKENYWDSWFAPFYYANSYGDLVTPVYGQCGDSKWGLPFWYLDAHTFASPLWYHHTDGQDLIDKWMIPVLLSGGVYRDGSRRNGFLLNIAGYRADDSGYRASWFVPFYFHDNEDTFVTPLYGYHKTSQWCFPLWYNDEESLMSLAWCQRKNPDGSLRSWAIPLLLSGGRRWDDGTSSAGFLMGLGGYNDRRGAKWCLPLFFNQGEDFLSLPYVHLRNDASTCDTYVIPPLLSGFARYDSGRLDVSALILYGHGCDDKGKTRFDYLLPLYFYDGKTGDCASLLCGRLTNGASVERWWLTPLVGTHSGARTGAWFFPLFNRAKDAGFDKALARLDAATPPAGKVEAKVRGSVLLGADFDHSVTGADEADVKTYRLREDYKSGNRLFFNNEGSREIVFDNETRQKKSDTWKSETMALCGLFYRTHEADTMKGTSHIHTRVLWKLWDREETNGDVTLDAFPGFTYDSKTNGYSRTSFLWRFFRYETDPQTGTKLDLLFLPLIRSRLLTGEGEGGIILYR